MNRSSLRAQTSAPISGFRLPALAISARVFGVGAVALAVTALLAIESGSESLGLDLGAIAAALASAWLFMRGYAERRNALNPICLVALTLFLHYPVHVWLTGDSMTLMAMIGVDAEVWRTWALLTMTVSVFFVWLGYSARVFERFASRLPSPRWIVDDDHPRTRSIMIVLYLVGFAPRLIAAIAGQGFHWGGQGESLADIAFILSVLGGIPSFAAIWLLIHGLRSGRRRLVYLALGLLALEIAWSLLSGSRLRIVMPILAAFVAYAHLYRPVRLARFIVLVVVFTIVLVPFLTAFRSAVFGRAETLAREGIGSQIVIESLGEASSSLDDVELTTADGALPTLANRFHAATSLALVIRYTPERQDYYLGVPYLMVVPQILVPRFVWPDKPSPNPFGDPFRFNYWGLRSGDTTSVAVSQLGDFWVNLHLPGVFLGSILFGAIIAFLFKYMRMGIAGPSIFPSVVFAVHSPLLVQAVEGSFDGFLTMLPKTLLVYFAIAWLISRGRRRFASDPSPSAPPVP